MIDPMNINPISIKPALFKPVFWINASVSEAAAAYKANDSHKAMSRLIPSWFSSV